jgi:hypothetical protein
MYKIIQIQVSIPNSKSTTRMSIPRFHSRFQSKHKKCEKFVKCVSTVCERGRRPNQVFSSRHPDRGKKLGAVLGRFPIFFIEFSVALSPGTQNAPFWNDDWDICSERYSLDSGLKFVFRAHCDSNLWCISWPKIFSVRYCVYYRELWGYNCGYNGAGNVSQSFPSLFSAPRSDENSRVNFSELHILLSTKIES